MGAGRAKAKIRPTLVGWARTSARLSIEEAASRAKIAPTMLAAWEAGDDLPSIAQLRKLAAIYKRPIVVFYLPEPPKDFDALRDFRRLPGEGLFESPELAGEIRWAHEMREVALEACAATETEIPLFALAAHIDDPPDGVAQAARTALGVDVSEGERWTNPYDAFNRWREAVEDSGVLCLQFSGVEVDEARAFAIIAAPLPAIAVNAADAINARLFSLLHELVHLMLGSAGKCDLHESHRSVDDRDRIETYCNAVAGRILVPRDALQVSVNAPGASARVEWDDESLRLLARRYGVSRETILRRLLDIGRTTPAHYEARRRDFLAAGKQAEKPGGGDYYRNLKAKLGAPLIRTVISAYHSGRLTANEAAAYLNVKVGNLDRLMGTVR